MAPKQKLSQTTTFASRHRATAFALQKYVGLASHGNIRAVGPRQSRQESTARFRGEKIRKFSACLESPLGMLGGMRPGQPERILPTRRQGPPTPDSEALQRRTPRSSSRDFSMSASCPTRTTGAHVAKLQAQEPKAICLTSESHRSAA